MASFEPPSTAASRTPPRLGILVDCKQFKAKIHAGPSPAVPRRQSSTPRRRVRWRWPLVLAGLSLLFAISITAGALRAVLSSNPAPATASPVPQIAQKKQPPAGALAQLKAQPAKTPAKSNLKPAMALVNLESKSARSSDPAPPEKVELPHLEDVAATGPVPPLIQQIKAKEQGQACGTETCNGSGDFFGTAVTFVASPKIAEEEAAKQHKLVFILHVSGNFEDPGFT
jgi:hypothetical protein